MNLMTLWGMSDRLPRKAVKPLVTSYAPRNLRKHPSCPRKVWYDLIYKRSTILSFLPQSITGRLITYVARVDCAFMTSPHGQARREPQRGPGKHSCGAPKHVHASRGPSGEKTFEFFFSKWYILAYYIFMADGGAPGQTSRGPG